MIPERILTRAPSAELRENQTDWDSLPPYDVLDAIMRMYMEEDRPLAEIVAAGYAQADVERVTRLIKINEYKRRQAADRHSRHASRVRARLALSDHVTVYRTSRLSGAGPRAARRLTIGVAILHPNEHWGQPP